jgi:hypothetical protein
MGELDGRNMRAFHGVPRALLSVTGKGRFEIFIVKDTRGDAISCKTMTVTSGKMPLDIPRNRGYTSIS